MSTNTTIQEGGKGYPFGPVKCLMVEGDNGEFCPWYPDADRALDSLSVTQNGIYRASDRGVYGWSRVSVNVSQSDRVTGKDPETGEEKTVTVDPDTGELVETVVPVEIRVTTLPTKTEYTEGETIDYSGIVVHAYSSTGQDMGAVPFSELVFPVTTVQGWGEEWSDGQGLNAKKISYMPQAGLDMYGQETILYVGPVLGSDSDGNPATFGSSDAPATLLVTRYNNTNYTLRINGSDRLDMYAKKQFAQGLFWSLVGGTSASSTTDRFTGAEWSAYLTDLPNSSENPTAVDPTTLHATQSLPVQWQNPDSGAVLETSFNITVTGGN